MKHLCFALIALAAPALADAELNFSMTGTDSCFDGGHAFHLCIGESARQCMEETPGGYSTVVTGACFDAEFQVWDMRLNAAYGEAMSYAREMDAEAGPGAPSRAEALRAMQRAWIPYRDALCDFEHSKWGGGTGGGPALIGCLMEETARQTQVLQFSLMEG